MVDRAVTVKRMMKVAEREEPNNQEQVLTPGSHTNGWFLKKLGGLKAYLPDSAEDTNDVRKDRYSNLAKEAYMSETHGKPSASPNPRVGHESIRLCIGRPWEQARRRYDLTLAHKSYCFVFMGYVRIASLRLFREHNITKNSHCKGL